MYVGLMDKWRDMDAKGICKRLYENDLPMQLANDPMELANEQLRQQRERGNANVQDQEIG
jgi:hypothetical protein